MVYTDPNNSAQRLAAAARVLIEGARLDQATGFSRTLFLANKASDAGLERCAFNAALERGIGAVSMRFDRDKTSTPRRVNIAYLQDGNPVEVTNCVIWSGRDDELIVLVPFDAREDCHYAVGPEGIERRTGRPAVMLGQGMSRAKARLERAAKDLRHRDLNSCVSFLTKTDAA